MLLYSVKKLEFNEIKNTLSCYCSTEYGRYEVTLMKFFREKHDVEILLDAVTEAYDLLTNEQINFAVTFILWEELKNARIKKKILSGLELYKIAVTLKSTSKIKDYFSGKNTHEINKLCANITEFTDITSDILNSIGKEGNIFDKASPVLAETRAEIRKLKNEIESTLSEFVRKKENQHIIQEFLVTQRENRYVIPIKKDHKGRVKGIVLDTSNSGETLFIEPQFVVNKNNELIEYIKKEKVEENKILRRLSSYINKHWKQIKETLRAFGKVDLCVAKARYAHDKNLTRPKINDRGYWNLKKARHPLLSNNVVPINMHLGKDFIQLIITGPNTGGKTVSLKTIGLLTLMSCAGLYIPADEDSEISVVDTIFLDIGDEQSIHQNLSTFSGHINRIKKILKTTTEKSLVLIDELGAGTDPLDGAALGVSILEQLLSTQSRVIVTTHFEQIKNFSFFNENVETASVAFDVETLTPKYELLMGIAGKSDALLIAGKLGLDEKIIERAKNYQSSNNFSNQELIEELNREKQKYLTLIHDAEKMHNQAETRIKTLDEKEKELKLLENEIKKGEVYKSLEAVKQTRDELNKIRLNLEKREKDKKELEKDISKVEELGRKLFEEKQTEEEIDTEIDLSSLKSGVRVLLSNLKKQGVVTDYNEKKGVVTVIVGNIKIKTPVSDIEKILTEQADTKNAEIKVQYNTEVGKPELECHIRGMRGFDAMKKAESYIESLVIHNHEKGRIVHGKGEGILRQMIHDLLKEHPSVKRFELAHPSQGGWGVTEFWLDV